ncbi:MAG: HpyAIV family type II restriction enzyme [Aquificaceae bacterium]
MNYKKFFEIMNKHIFKEEKKELLRRISTNPERFIGLFRPSKPEAKILQHLLQSHEIRMGDALEEILEEILKDLGFEVLPKIIDEEGERLVLDQYFRDNEKYYFIEQKVRDDHDSTKKRGQISNFEAKLKILYKKHHGLSLVGIMYFIDPDFSKNKNYYSEEFEKLKKSYSIELYLFYGKELFEYLNEPDMWNNILLWLKQWKDNIPSLPEVNFDITPKESFEEIKELDLRSWKKLLEDDKIWEEGIMKVIFRKGTTLKLLLNFFKDKGYADLVNLLTKRMEEWHW